MLVEVFLDCLEKAAARLRIRIEDPGKTCHTLSPAHRNDRQTHRPTKANRPAIIRGVPAKDKEKSVREICLHRCAWRASDPVVHAL